MNIHVAETNLKFSICQRGINMDQYQEIKNSVYRVAAMTNIDSILMLSTFNRLLTVTDFDEGELKYKPLEISCALYSLFGGGKWLKDDIEPKQLSIAFCQCFASGLFRGEDFRTIRELAPHVIEDVSKLYMCEVSQVLEMAISGRLTEEMMMRALITGVLRNCIRWEG